MFACEYHFFPSREQANGPFVEKIWSLVGSLSQNGQTINNDSLILPGANIRYLCICPERDSLAERFLSKWGRRDLREIKKYSIQPPTYTVIGEVADLPPACNCKQRPFVYLFTHFMTEVSPVVCGKCDRPIPLYRLPVSKDYTRNDFLRWQEVFQDCDSLFMMSSAGEKFGYDQLSKISSGLTSDGRELCSQLEQQWKVPVYYYLHRYYGVSAKLELKRRCPGCHGEWLMGASRRRYGFQCEKCRLLSVAAVEFENPAA